MSSRLLHVAARAEALTLVLLLANLATVHIAVIASVTGPAHGCAYLVIVVGVLRDRTADRAAKLLAFLPGVGGLLVLRRLPGDDPGRRSSEEDDATAASARTDGVS